VQQAVREVGGQQLDQIADWLAQRYLLIGIPFENLVAHAALLPQESVRFFYIDSNWLDALTEGALSIGIESSRDRLYQDLMKDLIWNTAFAAMQQVRNNLLGATPPTPRQHPLIRKRWQGCCCVRQLCRAGRGLKSTPMPRRKAVLPRPTWHRTSTCCAWSDCRTT